MRVVTGFCDIYIPEPQICIGNNPLELPNFPLAGYNRFQSMETLRPHVELMERSMPHVGLVSVRRLYRYICIISAELPRSMVFVKEVVGAFTDQDAKEEVNRINTKFSCDTLFVPMEVVPYTEASLVEQHVKKHNLYVTGVFFSNCYSATITGEINMAVPLLDSYFQGAGQALLDHHNKELERKLHPPLEDQVSEALAQCLEQCLAQCSNRCVLL